MVVTYLTAEAILVSFVLLILIMRRILWAVSP
jgi:hypothetical protein